jgi:3-oxoadipate enol-lactonase/4-carboxymuconolactone decarboxylase
LFRHTKIPKSNKQGAGTLPFVTVNNMRLYYRREGCEGRPVLVLAHSIGADHGMWAPQIGALLSRFQVVRYDTRGHGASDAPAGEYSIEQLGRDVLALMDALGIPKFAFCGLSLGGMIGQWLGCYSPDRLTGLVLANTSPLMLPASNWDMRRKMVLEGGMAAIADMAMQRFFSAETLARGGAYAASLRSVILGTNPQGYAACCSAIRDMDHTALLREIRTPTLVISGDHDVSTPWTGHGEILAREIPGAKAVRLDAAHLSNIERPRSFTMALFEFLNPQDGADSLAEGYIVRREILGNAQVDQATAAANDFTRDFQKLITRYAWGSVWTRPGLSLRMRRLLALAIAASLGRWEEFRLHVRSGLARELELCDLRETLLHTAIYAGVPAANTAFHIADEEIKSAAH